MPHMDFRGNRNIQPEQTWAEEFGSFAFQPAEMYCLILHLEFEIPYPKYVS